MASIHLTPRVTDAGRGFTPSARTRRIDHRFYTFMASAISAGVFLGFSRTYFLKSYFHAPAIPFWVHVHGAVFTAWMLLYLAQNLLALNGQMRWHRRMGILGVILSLGVVGSGTAVVIRQASQGRSFPFPDTYSLLAVSFGQMILFAGLVTAGLLLRRDGETHKRLLLMAPLLFFFPVFGRLLGGINPVTLLLALCFFFAGSVYDLVTRRRIHTAYRWGVPLLVFTTPPFGVLASHAVLWRHFADWLLR